MAESDSRLGSTSCMDPKSGFCLRTGIFHSLRPPVPLPLISEPLSLTQFTLSLLRLSSPATNTTVLIDSDSGYHLSYPLFLRQVQALSSNLRAKTSLSKGDVAFILSPTSLQVPVLYFSLLSLGVVVSPANPLGTGLEVARQIQLCKPVIAFATSSTANKIPNLKLGCILIDSPEFFSMTNETQPVAGKNTLSDPVMVKQSDSAAILYSSGTTGRVKGVLLNHRNFIALIAGFYSRSYQHDGAETPATAVSLFTLPLFHVFGFFMLVRAISLGETLVLLKRFDFEGLLKAVEKFRVHYMPVSPPLVVALVKSDLTAKYDLSSLLRLSSGGAPLAKEIVDRFREKFPNLEILQGYGLTESGGGGSSLIGPEEYENISSVGKLAENMEAMIIDSSTGEALPPGLSGELWLRGPTIMKGYIGDEEATSATLDPEGWLKTGDLCYFDSNGYLYVVDRLKELIKYKAYQVPPAELEHLLQSNSEIADAAVVPFPDEEAGEIPMAYVVRKPQSNISEAHVIDFVAKKVAPYKKIRRVAFVNTIPKSPAGKILRRELVKHAVSQGSSKL